MTDRSKQRADTAREHDDSELIERMEDSPGQGGRSGGRMARDVGTQDELERETEGPGITRVRGSDKKEEADLPRFNQR